MASAELNKLLESLKKTTSENNIPYMYVDTRKKVTVGVGHNLTAHKDMQTLPFKVKRLSRYPVRGGDIGISITTNKILGRSATKIEIKNEYDFLIKNHGLGKYLPTQLRKYTTLELSAQTVESLFIKDRDRAIMQAKKEFGVDFDSYPVKCQAAIVDLVFNLGSLKGFPTFKSAIQGLGVFKNKSMAERWRIAAKESRRPELSSERNTEVQQWLLSAAKIAQLTP